MLSYLQTATISVVFLSVFSSAQAQSTDKPRARELFYTPILENVKPPAEPEKKPAPQPQVRKKPRRPAAAAVPDEHASTGKPIAVEVPLVTAQQASYPPLAMRYSVLKLNSNGKYAKVDSDSVFHSGDKIRVSIEPNDAGYLYIVQRGTSKEWDVLFPSPEIAEGNNQVVANHRNVIPAGGRFYFNEQPGEEKIFIVLTRKPVPDLEQLIYTLRSKVTNDPAVAPAPEKPKTMMMAQNRVNDSIIDRLRSQVNSRDLVFEKIDDDTPEDGQGKTVYVAKDDRTAGATVIADVTLKHE